MVTLESSLLLVNASKKRNNEDEWFEDEDGKLNLEDDEIDEDQEKEAEEGEEEEISE